MSLLDKINQDLKTAMKEKQTDKLSALRAIKSELLLEQTSGSGEKITEEKEIKIVEYTVKKLKVIFKEKKIILIKKITLMQCFQYDRQFER